MQMDAGRHGDADESKNQKRRLSCEMDGSKKGISLRQASGSQSVVGVQDRIASGDIRVEKVGGGSEHS